ncbi:MAG: lamin tail domain-containing protein [Planctomycetota bacterium]
MDAPRPKGWKRIFGSALACAALFAPFSERARAVVVITEIMYHPEGNDRELEYVELHNETPDPVDLTGFYFSEGISFTFTQRTFLEPGQYIAVCANAERIRQVYGITNVAGNWDPATALDNGGECVSLANPGGAVECTVRYNDRGKWPSAADGTGHSLELISPYLPADDPDSWAASARKGGSPGKANDVVAGVLPVVLNEALLLPESSERWVELYNKGDDPIDLSGYILATDRAATASAVLPPGTTIAGRSWLSFSDAALGLDFTPRSETPPPGEPAPPARTFVALFAPDRSRVVDARLFEPLPGTSEARVPDGGRFFSSVAAPTRGGPNRVDAETDVVIHEILYHPIDRDVRREFVELYNRSSERTIDLGGWRFADGIDFTIPQGTALAPNSYLVVARDPEFIRNAYGLPSSQVVGPEDDEARARFGVLRDRGERIRLVDARGAIADEVSYHDGGEWPRWADGGGSSLELIDPFQDNSVAQAWDASDEAPKSAAKEYSYLGVFTGAQSGDTAEFHLVVPGGGIAVVDDLSMTSEAVTIETLATYFAPTDAFRYFKGTQEPSDPVSAWRQPDFDDSEWQTGACPIGYGDGDEATLLEDMRGNYASFYVRKEFTIPDLGAIERLILQVEYDDGFAAYLNGVPVASVNLKSPEDPTFDSFAATSKEKAKEAIDLTARVAELVRPGKNVLAFQVHNFSISNVDIRFQASLIDGRYVVTKGPNLFKDGTFETTGYRSSWIFDGTHIRSGRTTVEPLAGAGSLKIVSTGGGDNKVNRIETSNTGLAAPTLQAEYRVSFLARWIAGSPTLLTHGSYVGSSRPSYAHATRLEVPERLGTPGAPNSVSLRQEAATGSRNLGPVIWGVSHDPATPRASRPVTVRARVYDPDGVSEVAVHYSLNTPKAPDDAGHFVVPMTGPDRDGTYTAEIPGQTNLTRVVFYIAAADSGGRPGRYPLDAIARTHPLVLDPAAATLNDHRYLVYRHDNAYTGRLHSYRMWLHSLAEQYLSSCSLLSNDYVYGTFLFQDRQIYYNSQVRFAGSPWARQRWTESYRVKMPKDKPLHGYIRSFNLEDHQGGGARDGRDRITNYLIRSNQGPITVPYLSHWLARWQVNDRVNEDREHISIPNRDFVSRWYPDDDEGDLFEMDDRFEINDGGARANSMDGRLLYPPYGPVERGEDKEEYRYYFNIRAYRELDDHTNFIALAKLMTQAATPNDAFDAKVWDQVNVEEFCRVWAIRMNVDDWDTWGTDRGKNCYLYRLPADGRWVVFPWDSELTYGNVGSFAPPALTAASNPTYTPGGKFPEVTRFINRVPIKRLFYGILKDMTVTFFNSDYLTPYMLQLDKVGVTNSAVGKKGGYIDQRKNLLANAVLGVSASRVKFAVTTNGGAPLTTADRFLTVQGTAPVEIYAIVAAVDGRADREWSARFSDTSVVGWTASGPLSPGAHTIEFVGFDARLDLFDSVVFEVTVTDAPRPEIASVEPREVAAGGRVTVRGTGFAAGLRVFFGYAEATAVSFDPGVDPAVVEATVPTALPPGAVEVRVRNLDGQESEPYAIEILPGTVEFVRGDADMDGLLAITDAIVSLNYLFLSGAEPPCLDAADATDDGKLNLTDPIYALDHLFRGGPEPPPPYPEKGVDRTEDNLDCKGL